MYKQKPIKLWDNKTDQNERQWFQKLFIEKINLRNLWDLSVHCVTGLTKFTDISKFFIFYYIHIKVLFNILKWLAAETNLWGSDTIYQSSFNVLKFFSLVILKYIKVRDDAFHEVGRKAESP